MIKLIRILLKLAPFIGGLAYIVQHMDKKPKRQFSFKRFFWLLLLVPFLIVVCLSAYVWSYYDSEFTGKSDNCAVVFGAAVWKNDQPSWALSDRTDAAIDLYTNGQVPCLIFSGGASTFGAHESVVMQTRALQNGVAQSDITLDLDGNNTLATMLNLKKEPGYVLVSNDFHLARINLMAWKLGLKDYHLHAAPYVQGRYQKDFKYFAREVLGSGLTLLGL